MRWFICPNTCRPAIHYFNVSTTISAKISWARWRKCIRIFHEATFGPSKWREPNR